MENTNKSSSLEQAEAEKVIFEELEAILKIPLIANPKIYWLNHKFCGIKDF